MHGINYTRKYTHNNSSTKHTKNSLVQHVVTVSRAHHMLIMCHYTLIFGTGVLVCMGQILFMQFHKFTHFIFIMFEC